MPAARIGDMDRRVTILRATIADDGFAREKGEPVPIGTRWAARNDMSDRDRLAAAQAGAEATTRFVMAYDSLTRAITADDVLECEGTTYQIVGKPKEVGRRDGIEITAASI